MKFILRAGAFAGLSLLVAGAARAQTSQSSQTPQIPTSSENVVVSATKVPQDPVQVPGAVSVVTGEQLQQRGARTLADALQDVVGLDTGNGSDNGSRVPNAGLWGLKEFDALLFTVDGVPVGGPFNPSLTQIPIENIERIEIVRGPQGTLYGVSAFAGMIQVFTRHGTSGGSVHIGGGSFSDRYGNANYTAALGSDFTLRAFGSIARGNGWQDRTDVSTDRFSVSGEKKWGSTVLDVNLAAYRDTQHFGSPLPVNGGQPMPGFEIDRNYAVDGARLDHRVYSLFSNLSVPLSRIWRFENTLGLSHDDQISVRSFIDSSDGKTAQATGVSLKPLENTVYDDARAVAEFEAAGKHRLVGGAAITWGRTTADGHGFDFELHLGPPPVVPALGDIPPGDNRSFRDERTFFGLYVNDEWTPIPSLTFTGGARYDNVSETLHVFQQEIGTPSPDIVDDSKHDGQWSGGLSALFRAVDFPSGTVNAVNLYVSARSAFKPAAPNLSEAESAKILEPERTRSGELGVKTRWFNSTLSFDVSLFHMIFENLVVSVPDINGEPSLTNAGSERFQGMELQASYLPPFAEGFSLAAGYAHHDARYMTFSFFTPDGEPRVVDGKRLELVPRDLWNVGLSYSRGKGPGAFVAVRHQSQRPLNRRNTFYTDPFYETDAGVSWNFSSFRLAVVGRNLGDDRHYVSDSEIGDSQFYVAAPRRFTAELTMRF
jgi:outer membrane receptor protein involved in Fe transport